MKLGWNLLVSAYWNRLPTHSDLLRQSSPLPSDAEAAVVVDDARGAGLFGRALLGLNLDGLELVGAERLDPPVPAPGLSRWALTGERLLVRRRPGYVRPPAPGPLLVPETTGMELVAAATGLNPHLRAVIAASPGPLRVMDLCGPYSLRGVTPPWHPLGRTGYRPDLARDGWGDQLGWAWDDIAALEAPDLWVAVPTHVDVAGARECGRLLGRSIAERGGLTRRVRAAWSNEAWRGGNRVKRHVEEELWHLGWSDDPYVRLAERYALHAADLLDAFFVGLSEGAPGVEAQRVCEWQAASPWPFQLDHWRGSEPVSPQLRELVREWFDALAVAAYAGEGSLERSPDDALVARSIDVARQRSAAWAEVADGLGKPLLGYEKGFHWVGRGGVEWAADPRSEVATLTYLQAIEPYYDAACLYGLGGEPHTAEHGSWSHLASMDEATAPQPRLRGAARYLGRL
jgi:hypothetical protein